MPVGFWNDPDVRSIGRPTSSISRCVAPRRLAERTTHDGLIIFGRSDATLNPGGVRIGTAEIYRQVERLPEVLESLVVGQEWRTTSGSCCSSGSRGLTLDDGLRERHPARNPD